MGIDRSSSAQDCHSACLANAHCSYYTYYPAQEEQVCFLMDACSEVVVGEKEEAVSGAVRTNARAGFHGLTNWLCLWIERGKRALPYNMWD